MRFTFVCLQSQSIKPRKGGNPRKRHSHTTLLHQLSQQPTPFLPEQVGSRQAAVSADHAQIGDAALYQVVSSLQTALVGAELFTAGAADHSSTLMGTQTSFSSTSTDAPHDVRVSEMLLTTCSMLETLSHEASLMLSPPSTMP